MYFGSLLFSLLLFMSTTVLKSYGASIIVDLLRNNVAGPAVNFQTVSWPIDPEAGLRRRKEYEAINGRYGWKHVERLGLGEDGKTEERRIQQRLRDEIGAFSYVPPLYYVFLDFPPVFTMVDIMVALGTRIIMEMAGLGGSRRLASML